MDEQNRQETDKKVGYFSTVTKRDNRVVSFDKTKIADAIFKAAVAVGGQDWLMAEELASAVTLFLRKKFGSASPTIEQIQDIVEKVLIETGHAKTAKAYILYREKRAQARKNVRVRKRIRDGASSTDLSLLVTPLSKDEVLSWDKGKIALALQKEAGVEPELAYEISSAVEEKLFNSELTHISTSLIRELVDNELFVRGLNKKLATQAIIGMPTYDLETLIFSKSKENANLTTNNPEAINLAIAETTLKQYALQRIFSQDIAESHMKGKIHLHDLGYPRVYCSSHSLEYLKKYGLCLGNLDTQSAPAKHARTLTGHLNTFLASMQAYYAGALGVGYINIMYAPYLVGMSDRELRQEAQHLIFSASQNAFSRGGQSLFTDHNVHTGVPDYLKKIPAIGPNGKYTGKTYADYEETAQRFAKAMLSVWRQGDRDGRPFAFPKCLDKDTELLLRIDGRLNICTAGQLHGIKSESPSMEIELPNFNLETMAPEWVKLKSSLHRGKETGIAVTLPNKVVLKTTTDHPHIVLTKDGLETKEAQQLHIGDILLYRSPGYNISSQQKVKIDVFDILKKRKITGLIFGGRLYKELLKGLIPGYQKSSTKEVPWAIFDSPSSIQKGFLQGLFNGDGAIKGSTISYVTKSKKLAYSIQILLSRLGIYSTIYQERVAEYPENIYFHLSIKGKSNLSEALDFLKNKKFFRWPKEAHFGDNIDIGWHSRVPVSLIKREDLRAGEGWKLRRHGYLCRETLVKLPQAMLLEHLIPMPVKKIEEAPVDAYAIEVEGQPHTFITADGILTHNCDLHISDETFKDPKQREILDYACQIASENGAPYFVFDRDVVTLSACCRLRTKISDNYMIEHPESMRFCGFANITINLPQAAYRAGKGNINVLYKEIDRCMELAVKAHLQKKEFIWRLMSRPGLPMWEVGKLALDGRPYIDLDKATYIIGIIGLNECLQYLTGRQLHDGEEVFRLGLKIISFMYFKAKEAEKKLGLKFSLEESPAESATRRLAKVDLRQFQEEAYNVIKGDIENDMYYYTNSIHFAADAPVDLVTRIQKQSKFHTMIESGAIIHAFVGERLPSKESIMNLVEKTYYNTQAAQITISPEFTVCNGCSRIDSGLHELCRACGSDDVYGMTRIVGYYSRINNWNKSKLGELADRRRSPENYAVTLGE